jgi:hypothetical protein
MNAASTKAGLKTRTLLAICRQHGACSEQAVSYSAGNSRLVEARMSVARFGILRTEWYYGLRSNPGR